MKIDKAIKIKENHQRLHRDEYYPELLKADNLSIEALKLINRQRHGHISKYTELLLGETED